MSQHQNSNEVFKFKQIRPAPLQSLHQLNFQVAIKESCWKHTVKSKQANVPPLRKEGRKQKEVMSHKFWQIDHGSIRVNCIRGKTTGCYLLESWVVSVCHRMYWPLELLNSVQPSFRCTDEILGHNLLSEAVPPPPFWVRAEQL